MRIPSCHHGPLRLLQRLYPKGDAICRQVLVHPPGGVVGNDVLAIDTTLAAGSHALNTTPGTTRFYRSAGPLAVQQISATLADGARLEWLPLESIAYRRCKVENRLRFKLAPGAQMIGWAMLALGLPAAGETFDEGPFVQQLSLSEIWLERGRINGADRLLMDWPLGLAAGPARAWSPSRAGEGLAACGVGGVETAALGLGALCASGMAHLSTYSRPCYFHGILHQWHVHTTVNRQQRLLRPSMPEKPFQETLLRLRLSVGLLGERAANGWWPTSFLEASSRAFLDPVFVRTGLLAQMHGVTEAARRVHDARLAAGSFHLFRLPEEAEQDLYALLRDGSRSGGADVPHVPSDAADAMTMLDELAVGTGVDAPGPKLMGDSGSLGSADAWRQVAGVYRDAFRKGFQSYPYFSRA